MKAAALIKKHGIVKWSQVYLIPATKFKVTIIDALTMVQTIQPVQFREPLRHALTMDPEWAELEKEACTKSNLSIGHFVVGHEILHFENDGI